MANPIKTFDQYQKAAETFAVFKSPDYPYLALAEECGEFLGKLAKAHRGDSELDVNKLDADMHKELGDVLWVVAAICSLRGWTLQGLAEGNINKLADRKNRGVLNGSGDNR